MISRHVLEGTSFQDYALGYDAENRLVQVNKNGSIAAQFTFDADGKRVKSVMGADTILFVGAHYEVKNGSEITKYYMAGTTRIAMRKYTIPQNMTVEYFLSDHLGSTSLTADANGNKVLELRYKAWGEIRATWTSSPSTTPAYKMPLYQYTGQAAYLDDPLTSGVTEGFGLMFYQSRWYDPALSRFTQPDTYITNTSVQSYDRFVYTNNNPLRYADPTGHFVETVIDIISVGMDVADIAQNGLNWGNGLSLAVDVASVLIPGIPAVGAAVRALNAVDTVVDTVNAVDAVVDAAKTADNVIDAANAVDNAGDTAKGLDCLVNSFSAETDVITSEGAADIATIQIGDYVLAWNEADGTLGFYQVTDTIHHTDKVVVNVILDGEWIETTPEHPFYVEGRGWVNAEDLQFGDRVYQADGTTGFVWLKWNVYKTQEMYNLTVDTAHTFFVGEGQWLVHNCGGSPFYRGGDSLIDNMPNDVKKTLNRASDTVGPGAGPSIVTDPAMLPSRYTTNSIVDLDSIPDSLQIVQRGKPWHYQIEPMFEMSYREFLKYLEMIRLVPSG